MNANQSFRSCDGSAGGELVAWEKFDESTPSCPSSKATDETNELDPEQRQKDQTRHTRRLKKLKAHHDKCEARYKAACVKMANEEKERTSCLHEKGLMQSQQSSSESDDTIILGPTPAAVIQDMSVPELARTDSVILHEQMLGYTEEAPSSSEISEEEYVPESVESDSDSSVDVKQLKKKRAQKTTSASSLEVQPLKRRCVTTSCSLAAKDPGESSSADVNDPGESSSADMNDPGESSSPDVTVMTLKKKEDGSRVYNKRYYCVFCNKPYSKMSRHLEAKHSDKPEVANALKCPKGSKEQWLQFSLLRNKGNRAHNNKVIKEGKGMVIPRQQSTKPAKAADYLHCINCEGYLKRKSLWSHMRRCNLSQKVKGLKPGTSRVQALCKYAEPVPDSVNAQFWKLVLNMHHDDITKVVRSEKCILKLGEHLFNKHGQDVTRHEYIRQKMRETARVVLQGQKDGKLEMLSDFFVPANFPHVIDAVQKVAGLDERTKVFKTPSLALKLGHNLNKVASILECEAMISGDENTIQNVRVFKQICETRWSECVSSHALRTLNEAKWNAPQLIPFADDVRKMHQYLDTKRIECQRNLKEEAVKKNWAELAKITLCEVIIFNRRREGEVSKMPQNAFTLRDTSVTHPDVELALSELEKKLCKHFQRIEIKGKRGRKVPILLTPDMASSMELLVQNRRHCDVLDENPYMFGRPQTLNHFRGSDIIREIAQSCGAKHPEALSSTKLRKHMATMSKVLNLKDNEMDDLADFLGHDIRVHRQFYRLPEGTLQLAKISKVLLALERGQLSNFKGRNLDEISIDPQEKMSVDSGSDTEEEVDSSERDAATSSSRSPGQFGVTRRSTTEVGQNKDLPSAKERSDDKVPVAMEVSGNSNTTKGPSQRKRVKWSQEEIQAVEKTLMDCIGSGTVPGKAQCMKCIEASPVALENRTWQAVKFYVKNRIDALKRETFTKRTERDVSSWSSECLRKLLLGVRVEGAEGVCKLTDVTKLEGEASINNRKGKLFYFYEWQLRASWLGTSCGGVKFRGTVDVSNLSDENGEDELDISVALCKDQPNTPLLDLMKRSGVPEVRRVLGEYVQQLKSEFSQGMILPTADALKQPSPVLAKKNEVKTNRTQISPKCSSSAAPCPTSVGRTCSFNLKETFQTSADELYRTFISQEFVQAFTHSPAEVDGRCRGKFQLLDGNVSGEFTQLVPDQRIGMRWRFRTWPNKHYATVNLELEDRGDDTELRLECQGVPVGEEDSTREGWIRFYFQAIKQTFGY